MIKIIVSFCLLLAFFLLSPLVVVNLIVSFLCFCASIHSVVKPIFVCFRQKSYKVKPDVFSLRAIEAWREVIAVKNMQLQGYSPTCEIEHHKSSGEYFPKYNNTYILPYNYLPTERIESAIGFSTFEEAIEVLKNFTNKIKCHL